MKLDMEKPVAVGQGSSGHQGGLEILDAVQALHPQQVAPLLQLFSPLPQPVAPLPQLVVDGDDDGEEVAPLASQPEQVAPLPQPVAPLPQVLPPLPEPVVVDVNDNEDVAPLASQPEQVAPLPQPVAPLPRELPPLPEPMVGVNEDDEDILSEDVNSDEEGQMIYRRRMARELDNKVHDKRVRPRFGRPGYGCQFCNKLMKGSRQSVIQHAIGASVGSLKNGHAFRVAHTVYAEYLSRI